ncbi:MAG: hypothetical protein JO053_01485 [Acidobacteria bacterium]|nr:hypothetical protein [Acidobacteriota bacterium]
MFDSIGLQIKHGGFSTEKVMKSLKFGTAMALTATAKEAQEAVQVSLFGHFTLRGRWWEQGNKFGIKVRPATPEKLASSVRTEAGWLLKQFEGGDVFPYKHFLAIPTENVRPKGSTKIIRGPLKPANLKNSFVIKSKKSGASLLMQRVARGRNKGVRVMYILVPRIHVKPVDAFYDPIEQTAKRRLHPNMQRYMQQALDTIR